MSMQYTPNAIPTSPLYISCIVNIKHKARSWGISSQNFDLDYTRISSQIRVHGAFGAYSEVEKTWHIEFYMWGKYFGSEPFPFPFPSTTTATLISATNPAPVPTGPRAMNSTPVPNPYPPMYIPGPPQTPIINTINTGRFSPAPAPGSGSRANLSQYQNQYQHHQGSSPASGLKNGFTIRGIAAGGSPRYSNMGQAYNNRPTRGRGTDESRGTVVSKGGEGGGPRLEDSRGGGGQRNGRGAVYAARRQLKIARRTGGRN
ncbi:hypothetical protein BKA61DRAFT_676527 [Leptodontidium sp. MPI-SDFR-AT-0119]|nr:hypothetical protein BKA61DRAFT_676527 [Leptodontidium sp. MPI-SDFR-AT-0119]